MQRVHILQLVFVYLYRVRDRQRVFYSVVFESLVAISLSPFPLSVFLSSLSFSFVLCLCFSHLLPLPPSPPSFSWSLSPPLSCSPMPPSFPRSYMLSLSSLSFHCSLSRSLAPLSVPFISSLLNALLLSSLNSVFSPLYSVCFFFQAPHTPFSNVVSKQSYFIANILSFHLAPPATKQLRVIFYWGLAISASCLAACIRMICWANSKLELLKYILQQRRANASVLETVDNCQSKLIVHLVWCLFQTSCFVHFFFFFVFSCLRVQSVHTDLNGRSWRRATRVW